MATEFDFWRLLAGLGMFLFGMHLIEESVKSLSGKAFRRIIRQYTNGRLRAIGSGSLVTALLQSSSAVSLMVLAFVGASVMSMENAIGVIMGSNIGTTLTAWIVATVGFKINIGSFALPFIGLGAVGLIFLRPPSKPYYVCRVLIGFGLLFLGLHYMKSSVEHLADVFDLSQVPDYGLWFYLLFGTLITAMMQASAATIAIVLTALNSEIISFDIAAVMVIGANIGTTVTVLLGSIGGVQAKKRVGFSHLLFNIVTGVVAFAGLPVLVHVVSMIVNIENHSLMGLALFHTIFNILGVLLFLPFVGILSRMLIKLYPDKKEILTEYLEKTPTEVPEAATAALRKEVGHLLQECQLYNLRMLKIDEKLVFDSDTPFERDNRRMNNLRELYEKIKLLHGAIFAFYSKMHAQKLDEAEANELERIVYASRNIMNSTKNFKGIRHNMDEFEASDNAYINKQYTLFRKRLVELYHNMGRVLNMPTVEEQYQNLMSTFVDIEVADKRFISNTTTAVEKHQIQEMEIASLVLVNRLFTQSCRLQIYSLKDLLLTEEQVSSFDNAMDLKEKMDARMMRRNGNEIGGD